MQEDGAGSISRSRSASASGRVSRVSRLLANSATADAGWLVLTRALRALGDGAVSILLVSYLHGIGFSAFEVGAIVTGTLLGSAALTLLVGLAPHGLHPLRLLKAAALLMLATGIGFAIAHSFWPLFVIAVIGTLNPSAGDVSVFLPMEQTLLVETVAGSDRTRIFAWYNVCATLTGAIGALLSALPAMIARDRGWSRVAAERMGFVGYALLAVAVLAGYLRMSPAAEASIAVAPRTALARSRAIVMRLAVLFSLDSFGGGFVVQSLLVLWLFQRFNLSPQATAGVFFAAGLMGGLSQFVSAWLAERIGLINTMVFTHLPANIFCGAGRRDADRAPGHYLPAVADAAVADGRARAPILRDGGGAAAGTARGRQRHQRATQPGHRAEPAAGRRDAHSVVLRMAVDLRRSAKGRLRFAAADAVQCRQAASRE